MKKNVKTIALIAHDGKKAELINFVKDHMEFFKKFNLVATGTTGSHVQRAGLKVKRLLSGPIGGDAQIASLVATGKCQAVIFLRDPLGMHPHEPDIHSLLRICEVHDVPLATNLSTAQLLVKGLSNREGR
ncbi:MAG TPA: methylglyoxal synthase [Pseudobdellovibrionaceae bacterium]|nr:methylglyoxal synthase [Pseudobdellovibrionaceae bacterium]